MFCTLKSSWFHPLAVWLCTLNTIFMRDQINSLGEQRPLCTEQLLSGSPIHPPRACASNLFWGHHFRERRSNGTATSLRFPTSLLTLSVCGNCEGDFRDTLSLLETGLWTILCLSQRSLNICHMVLPLWNGCIAFKLVSRTAFSCFKLVTCWLRALLRRCIVTCWLTTSGPAVSPLRASRLAVCWHHDSLNWFFVTC